ncbi:MAG: FG-GAP-like repeat-containing protein [Bacteroidota bacterium]
MKLLAYLLLLVSPMLTFAQDTLLVKEELTTSVGTFFGQDFHPGDVNGDGWVDLIVGQPRSTPQHHGAIHIFHGSSSGFSLHEKRDYPYNYSGYGHAVAAADINNDGFDDVIVGAPWDDYGNPAGPHATDQFSGGAIYIYLGDNTGLKTEVNFSHHFQWRDHFYGANVSAAGDVNGDGKDEFLVSTQGAWVNGLSSVGSLSLFYGTSLGYRYTRTTGLAGSVTGELFSRGNASLGDINGDGYGDIVSGGKKRIHVFLGASPFIDTDPHWTYESPSLSSDILLVDGIGDVNGDGYDDMVYQNASNEYHVVHGSASGFQTSSDWELSEVTAYPHSTANLLTGIGDWNNDGYDDVIVGGGTQYAYIVNGTSSGLDSTITMVLTNEDGFNFSHVAFGLGDDDGDGVIDMAIAARDHNAVYIYELSADLIVADWSVEGNQVGSRMGNAVASAGDVNGDGIEDFIVGDYQRDQGFVNNGKALVYLGTNSGLQTTAVWSDIGVQHNDSFGNSVNSAGDVNKDGYDDIIIGSFGHDEPGIGNAGQASLYYGSSSGVDANPAYQLTSDQSQAFLGIDATGVGDINGDGNPDVAVSAYLYDKGETDEGVVFVYYGTGSGIDTANPDTLEIDQAGAWFGRSISKVGDVNLDGFDDLLIGAPKYDENYTDEGGAFLFMGNTTGITDTASWSYFSGEANAVLGFDLDGSGDYNNDGYIDLAIGAFGMNNPGNREGRVFVFYGDSTGFSNLPDFEVASSGTIGAVGKSLRNVGDANGDGYDDLLIGAEATNSGAGASFLYLGGANGLNTATGWEVFSPQTGGNFGSSVAGGDWNNDGLSDLAGGADRYTHGQTDEGGVFVYYSEDTVSVAFRPGRVLSIDDVSSPNLQVFPNPTSGLIKINSGDARITSVKLISLNGAELDRWHYDVPVDSDELDVSKLTDKLGLLLVTLENGETYRVKVLKE